MTEKQVEQDIQDGVLTTGNFTIQAQMPNGKSITMSGYIYSNNDEESISKQIDIYHRVADRQRLIAEIPELEAKMEQRIRNLHQLKDSYIKLKEKRDGGKKLSGADLNMIEQLNTNVKVLEDDIEKGHEALADARKKIG